MTPNPIFALVIRGQRHMIFDLAEQLGFEDHIDALAVSIFEDNAEQDLFHIQALYNSESTANDVLQSLGLDAKTECSISQLPDEDWVTLSQQGLPPVEAGRFWIYGAHDADKKPQNIQWPIHIEAGQAFGTGHHGTTKGCLLIFDELLKSGESPDRVLDLGCGAGTLAIAAAKALHKAVAASDIDPEAVNVTQQNAVQNQVGHLVKAFAADGFDSPDLEGRTFDLIFANILAGPLMLLAPSILKALQKNGHVILSGILDEQADKVSQAFQARDIAIKKGPSLTGWTSLLGQKIT